MYVNKQLFFFILAIVFISVNHKVNGQLSLPPSIITSNVAEANQYKVVYELNIPNNMTALTYAQNLSATTGVNFTRVAYFMQLDSRWVWVSMNKFNSNLTLAQLGIPFGSSPNSFQQIVTGMNVLGSSNSNVTNASNINGNIEIWPNCYGTNTGLGGIGGNTGTYDFNDILDNVQNCYGSFQVHNYGIGQTIFAYNCFNNAATDDLGIGNNSGNIHSDWTFMSNAASYTNKKLFILVNACSEITINTHPSTSTQNFCLNATETSLSVSALANSGIITGYQWYRNTTASYSGATLISGATSSSYLVPTNSAGTNFYYCVVTNSNGCGQFSNFSGAINVNSNPSFTTHPSTTNQSRCLNSAATALSVVASAGSGSISSYQWFKSTANSNASGTSISGATSTSYTPPTNILDSGYFYCLVTNSNACATKSNISGFLKVDPFVNKGTVSANQVVCHNTNASDVSITGNTGTIQWQSSINNSTWTNISGATNATLTSAQIGTISTTTFVRAQLTAGGCSDFSNTVILEVNNALAFDGTGDFVNIGNNASLNFTSNFTIESWVFVPAFPKYSINTIFSKKNPGVWTGYMFGFNNYQTTDLKLTFECGNSFAISSTKTLNAGSWNHVAIVVSNNGTLGTFYLNGSLVGNNSILLTNASSFNEFIGSMDAGGMYSLQGSLDELRIWNVARTQQQIIDNMDNSLTGSESGLVAYYDFDQGIPGGNNTGITSVLNKTANSLNGTFTGISRTGTTSNFVAGNHATIVSSDYGCVNGNSARMIVGATGRVPSSIQWYRNTTNSTIGATLIPGATSQEFNTDANESSTKFYYATVSGTCAASANSNIISLQNPVVTGTLDVYEDNTTQLACTDAAAASTPWVSLNTSLLTTSNTGLITGIYPGIGKVVYTTNAGCKDTVTVTVHETEWTGNQSNDFTTGSNWKLNTRPSVIKKIRFNSNASNNLILTSNIVVDSIDFGSSNRQIELGNNNLIVNHIRNFNSNRYIKTTGTGKVKKQLTNNTSFIFPVGISSYNPITITNKTGISDSFSVRILDTSFLNGTTSGAINNPHVKRTWDINKNTASANAGSGVDLSFTWNANEVVGTLANPTLNHHNGSGWEIPTMGTTSVSGTTLTYTGYKGTFSPFAIGGSTSVALPVELKIFNTDCKNDYTQVTWTTASEKDNDIFELYKSLDANTWTKIYTVKGQGTKATETSYSYDDIEKQSNYYRLKDIDFNGVENWSQIVFADCDFIPATIAVSPNPTKDYIEISIPFEENSHYNIMDLNGKIITSGVLLSRRTRVNIEAFSVGVYIVEIVKPSEKRQLKIIKQ